MFSKKKLAKARAAISNFLGTFAFVKIGGIGDFSKLSSLEIEHLMQELGWRALAKGRADAIAISTVDSWFNVSLNGVPLALPRYTLMTMRHCINSTPDEKIGLWVELDHWEKMRDKLTDGTLFLDVGAATGAMSVPFALSVEGSVRFVAFEPSLRARKYLKATIKHNKAQNVQVLPYALSDSTGTFYFMELPEDDTGTMPYLPEGSRLTVAGETLDYQGQEAYEVDVTTLDNLSQELRFADAKKLVIKIDVEGFEDKVLIRAQETLKRYKPHLFIDIHPHPGTQTLTDTACAKILKSLDYKIEQIAHVMLGIPQ